MGRRRAAVALAVAVALALGLAACTDGDDDGDDDGPTAAPSTTTTTEGATSSTARPDVVAVVDLGVGDCFDEGAVREDEPSKLQEVRVVDCAGPHRNEVYASLTFEADGDDYPGNGPLAEFAQERCVGEFADFVGAAVARTDYGIGTIYPDEASWATGDRVVLCVLYDTGDEPLEGSARDSEG